MTAPTIGTVIRCADQVARVYDTLESIARQSVRGGPVAIVSDPTTPAASIDWLRGLETPRGAAVVHADASSPAAVKNAGIAALASPYVMCIDAGDRLDPHFHETVLTAFDRDESIGIVATGMLLLGPGAESRVVAPRPCDLEAVLGDAHAIPAASAFPLHVWTAAGGFDETLSTFDAYELWIRILLLGRRCETIADPLLVRRQSRNALYRREWDPELRADAIAAITAKHRAAFAAHIGAALHDRENAIAAAAAAYQRAVGLHRHDVEELKALESRAAALRASLPDGGSIPLDLGDLRRTSPVARNWGYERGTPVDRYYIEAFLERCSHDIRGAVLEVKEPDYTTRFGGARVTRSDVVDLDPANTKATVISDLRAAANIADETYDCIILTQTLHFIGDMPAVAAECVRILKPGGVVLATLPCASRVCLEYGEEGDYWRLTEAGARRLFAGILPESALDIRAAGNVLSNAAFLYGLGSHELSRSELDAADPYFPLIVTVRARKPELARLKPSRSIERGSSRSTGHGENVAAILLYHRVAEMETDVHGLAVTPSDFREQMAHLRDHSTPMPLDDLLAAAREWRLPPRAVAVTFDDGYVDSYTEASPILAELGIPATFFVTTERLDEPYEFWWDVLERALLDPAGPKGLAGPKGPALRVELPDGAHVFEVDTAAQRLAAHKAIYDAIVGHPAHIRDAVVEQVVRRLEREGFSRATEREGFSRATEREGFSRAYNSRRMNATEIIDLASRPGHAIGAHSVRHLMLPRQPEDVQREEAFESRRTLEALLGRSVRAFAYPFGAVSSETVEAIRAAGFGAALTCGEAPVGGASDPLMLPRFAAPPSAASAFGEWFDRRFIRPTSARA